MSHSYDTSTYTIDVMPVPARLESPDQLRAAATEAFLAQNASADRLIYVHGATRSSWAVYTVKHLVEAVDLPSLGFLSDHARPAQVRDGTRLYRCHRSCPFQSVERGGGSQTPARARERESDARHEGGHRQQHFSVEEVAQATARDYVSSNPTYDYGNVRGDEGQGPDYFFTWLRSVLRVVEVALPEGRAVIHELKV